MKACLGIVDRALTPIQGDIVIAVVEGELTCKRLDLKGNQLQADLFNSNPVRHGSLEVMDIFGQINKKFGAGTLKTAAEGTDNKWAAKHENRSPRYTTRVFRNTHRSV